MPDILYVWPIMQSDERKPPMWKSLTALAILGSALAARGSEPNSRPEGVRYEVYYFHTTQRDGNCRDAEAWARGEADAIVGENGEGSVVFFPVDLEKDDSLAKAYKAKRMDVVVGEARDGKVARFANLGNLLPLVKGKKEDKAQAAIWKLVRDGLAKFDAKAARPWLEKSAKAKTATKTMWPTRPQTGCCESDSGDACCP